MIWAFVEGSLLQNEKLANGASQEHPFFRNISLAQYGGKGPLLHRTKLYACERSSPPEYYESHQGTCFSLFEPFLMHSDASLRLECRP